MRVFENWNRFVKETLSAFNEELEKEAVDSQEEKKQGRQLKTDWEEFYKVVEKVT